VYFSHSSFLPLFHSTALSSPFLAPSTAPIFLPLPLFFSSSTLHPLSLPRSALLTPFPSTSLPQFDGRTLLFPHLFSSSSISSNPPLLPLSLFSPSFPPRSPPPPLSPSGPSLSLSLLFLLFFNPLSLPPPPCSLTPFSLSDLPAGIDTLGGRINRQYTTTGLTFFTE
jgi:hypothetical protein